MSGEELGEGHSKLHTPTPWAQYHDDRLIIVDAEGSSLGEMTAGDPYISHATQIANAALVVTAVNSHEKLLACREALRALLGGDEKMQVAIAGNPNYVDEFIASARAALSASDEAST